MSLLMGHRGRRVAVAIFVILVCVISGFYVWREQTPRQIEASVVLDGVQVSAESLVYQGKGDVLLHAEHVLSLLGETGWRCNRLPHGMLQFQNKQNNTASIQVGETHAQFYGSSHNELTSSDVGGAPVILYRAVLVPLRFVEQWLNLSASWDAQEGRLYLTRGTPLDSIQENDLDDVPPDASSDAAPSTTSSVPPDASSDATPSTTSSVPPDASSDATQMVDCSYEQGGGRIELYAHKQGDNFQFVNAQQKPLADTVYAGLGSVSQPDQLLYQSKDGMIAGVITGLRAADGNIVYGVLSFDQAPTWTIPCRYDDIWRLTDGSFKGRIHGGGEEPF